MYPTHVNRGEYAMESFLVSSSNVHEWRSSIFFCIVIAWYYEYRLSENTYIVALCSGMDADIAERELIINTEAHGSAFDGMGFRAATQEIAAMNHHHSLDI